MVLVVVVLCGMYGRSLCASDARSGWAMDTATIASQRGGHEGRYVETDPEEMG